MLIAKMKELQVSFMVVGFYFGQVMTVTNNSGNTHTHTHINLHYCLDSSLNGRWDRDLSRSALLLYLVRLLLSSLKIYIKAFYFQKC